MRILLRYEGDSAPSAIEADGMTLEDDENGRRVVIYTRYFGTFVCDDKILCRVDVYPALASNLVRDGYVNLSHYQWRRIQST